MKLYFIFSMIAILLTLSIINAQITSTGCRTAVDSKTAITTYNYTKDVIAMKNVTIRQKRDMTEWYRYTAQLNLYLRGKIKTRPTAPTYPTIHKTIQVPMTTNKTYYSFDWTSLKIITNVIEEPVMTKQTIIESKLKDGYYFDDTKGEFYTYGKC